MYMKTAVHSCAGPLDRATCLPARACLPRARGRRSSLFGRCVFPQVSSGESFLSSSRRPPSSVRRVGRRPPSRRTWQTDRGKDGEERAGGREMGVSRPGPQGMGPIWRRSGFIVAKAEERDGISGGSRLESTDAEGRRGMSRSRTERGRHFCSAGELTTDVGFQLYGAGAGERKKEGRETGRLGKWGRKPRSSSPDFVENIRSPRVAPPPHTLHFFLDLALIKRDVVRSDVQIFD